MRPQIALLLLLALTACTGGEMPIDAKKVLDSQEGPAVPSINDEQTKAIKMLESKGDFKSAADVYLQMEDKAPDDLVLRLALADDLRRSGALDKAINAYNSILEKEPNNIAAKEGKGLALLSKGNYEAPTPLFEEVLKADPKRWKTLNALGILFITRGLNNEAQQYFHEASKQNPGSASVMNNLGLAQALAKQFASAEETMRQAAALAPEDSYDRKRVELNLALVYATAGDLENAKALAEKHLSGPQLSNNLGLYAHLAKDDRMAKDYLNSALSDSKVYYEKAWDNLDAINGTPSDSSSSVTSQATDATAAAGGDKSEFHSVEVPAETVMEKPGAPKSLGKVKMDGSAN